MCIKLTKIALFLFQVVAPVRQISSFLHFILHKYIHFKCVFPAEWTFALCFQVTKAQSCMFLENSLWKVLLQKLCSSADCQRDCQHGGARKHIFKSKIHCFQAQSRWTAQPELQLSFIAYLSTCRSTPENLPCQQYGYHHITHLESHYTGVCVCLHRCQRQTRR